MKKIFAVLFAAMMLIVSGAAMAEEEVTELNWADFEAQVAEAGIEGDMVTYEDLGMTLFVPSVFVEGELTEEDAADGLLDYYTTEDESAAVGVYYVEVGGGLTLEDYAAALEEEGVEADLALINGLGAVVYEDTEADAVTVVFATEDGNLITVIFAPASDEEFSAVALIMMASIQPAA